MDWQKLDLAKASVLKREVDVVLQRLYDTNPEINKAKLCSSVQYRIQELENFCAKNGDGKIDSWLIILIKSLNTCCI